MSIPGSVNPLFLGAAGQATGGGEYQIERSVRFNSPDSAYLSRTPGSASNRKTWTWAGWVKRSGFGRKNLFMSYDGSNLTEATYTNLQFSSADLLVIGSAYVTYRVTTQVFRDPSAWYHLAIAVDTTQATANDRIKIYVNGTQITAFNTTNNPSLNADLAVNATFSHRLGSEFNQFYFDGYLADVHFIDGQALTPTSFGEFDTNGVWQPIDASGLTYGTNGFRLPFSDNSSNAALGTDTSGNSNTWTVNNLDHTEYTPFQKIDALGTVTSAGGYTLTNVVNAFDADTNFLGTTWSSSGTGYADTITWTPGSNITVPSGYNLYFAIYYKTTNNNNRFFRFTDANGTDGTEVAVSSSNMSATTNYWTDVTSALPTAEANGDRIFSAFRYRDTVAYSGQFPRWYSVVIATSPPDSYNAPSNVTYLIDNSLGNPVNTGCDSLVDSPVNGSQVDTGVGGEVVGNYATFNPLDQLSSPTLTNGNLDLSMSTAAYGKTRSTIGFDVTTSTGYYAEITITGSATDNTGFGIVDSSAFTNEQGNAGAKFLGSRGGGGGNKWWTYNGTSVGTDTGVSHAQNQVIGVAVKNGKVYFAINNTWVLSGNPSTESNPAFSGLTGTVFLYFVCYQSNALTLNAGQRPFAYTAPSGFKALCTTNLPEPTIADGSTVMDVALYTGNGSTQTISGLNFSPDLVWIKGRSAAEFHSLYDIIRGVNNRLFSNTTGDESTATTMTAFNADGFAVSTDGGTYTATNANATTYVAWTWDAGSSTVTNTQGSITSQVRANASAGFSVVTYTGTNSAATVGHGLGVAPQMVIAKSRTVSNTSWVVYHTSLGGTNKVIVLNSTDAPQTITDYWGSAAPTSTVFGVANGTFDNNNGNLVAYCFAPVAGYSAYGSYTGNGSADGPFVFTGMRPRWVMIKNTTGTANWLMRDTERDPYNNNTTGKFYANDSRAERVDTTDLVDITSNGFKMRGTDSSSNASSATYIWVAFAEHPFQSSRAR